MSYEDMQSIPRTSTVTLPAYALLQQAVGKRLIGVLYYVLPGEFDIDEPNESGGCQVVRLLFEGGSQIAFDWVAESNRREDGINYRMHLSSGAAHPQAVRIWTQSTLEGVVADTNEMTRLDASSSLIWRNLVGKTLQEVRLLGVAGSNAELFSPQAVSLQFLNGIAFVSIGMTNYLKGEIIGDGDEILVFDAHEWKAALPQSPYWNLTEYGAGADAGQP